MSQQMVLLKSFSNDIDARMAQLKLLKTGVRAFVVRDDEGPSEPRPQPKNGLRLVTNIGDAVRAREALNRLYLQSAIELEIV
jgi:hypothetical protein